MDVKFNNLNYLHLLWMVLLLLAITIYGFIRKRRALERFASAHLLDQLMPNVSIKRQWIKSSLVLTAMVALIMGMVDPRWGKHYEDVQRRGIDILFVLDVSKSMLAEDIAPNRLERAKQYIKDVLDVLYTDRVGLITFAGKAVNKCPLTINYGSFRMILDEVGTHSAPLGGTLIGDAIRLAADSFLDKIKKYKVIIVITDGEDHESYPVDAAKTAYEEKGIKIYTIGLGDSTQGARIPVDKDGKRLYAKYDDQEIWSKMDRKILDEIAVAGGGASIPIGTKTFDMGQYYLEKIATADQREYESKRIERYNVQYQWFAGLALILLLIETWMTDRKPVSPINRVQKG